jgi:hypothetical protein
VVSYVSCAEVVNLPADQDDESGNKGTWAGGFDESFDLQR